MEIIRQELGKRLTVKEVACLFGVDARFVRQHYAELGGMRLGDRIYIFFEKEVINAIQRQNKRENAVGRAGEDQRSENQTSMLDKKGGCRVGNKGTRKSTEQGFESDPHGLLTGLGNGVS